MRILVVEDDRRTRETICRGLREQTWAVDQASTGEEALEKAAVTDYDAIVLDLMLPGLDGIEVCRRLRAAGSLGSILMLTARGALDDRVHGLDAGADDYLAKPFSFKELLARLRALSRRHGTDRSTDVNVGTLFIDRRKRRAFREGRPLALTSREYALLEHLASNAGRVIGRAELAEHVWDESLDPWSNTIEVHINRLRRKVDPEGLPRLIGTRRGEGYVIDVPEDSPGQDR